MTVISLSARRKVMDYKDSRVNLAMWFQTVVVVQINEVNLRITPHNAEKYSHGMNLNKMGSQNTMWKSKAPR